MFKKGLLFIMVLVTTFVLVSCGSSNVYEYILDDSYEGFITLGTSADYAPYEWPMNVDGKQTIVGIDIEIAKEVAKALKKNLKVINKGFDFLLDDLQNGKVDFVLAGMTPNEDRTKVVDFSKVYYEAIQVILIKESNLDKFASFESLDVATVKIGAQLGSIQQELAEEFTKSQKQFIQAVPDLVLRLNDGQIDAVILEKPVADGYLANTKGLAIANIAIGDPDGGSAVAVQKGNAELLAVVNRVIDELIESGKMDQIVNEMILKNEN